MRYFQLGIYYNCSYYLLYMLHIKAVVPAYYVRFTHTYRLPFLFIATASFLHSVSLFHLLVAMLNVTCSHVLILYRSLGLFLVDGQQARTFMLSNVRSEIAGPNRSGFVKVGGRT
jgi:hypothetical protein